MRYVGGKTRQAKAIRDAILQRESRTRYVEPFMGGCSVVSVMADDFEIVEASDSVPDLVLFWTAVRDGWNPPATLSREDYDVLRNAPPSPLRAWAGYAASYNGKWWGGYGPTASGRDYLAESLRSVQRKAARLKRVVFSCADYGDIEVDSNTVVYADPPYIDTLSYGATMPFNHPSFWATMESWVELGASVYVSEYTAPSDWYSCLNLTRVETMNHGSKSSGPRVEGLWTR